MFGGLPCSRIESYRWPCVLKLKEKKYENSVIGAR